MRSGGDIPQCGLVWFGLVWTRLRLKVEAVNSVCMLTRLGRVSMFLTYLPTYLPTYLTYLLCFFWKWFFVLLALA